MAPWRNDRSGNPGRMILERSCPTLFYVLGCLIIAFVLIQDVSKNPPSGPVKDIQITVQAGDTLWGLARENPLPGVATADVVARIISKNDLEGASIKPGQRLHVPVLPEDEDGLLCSE